MCKVRHTYAGDLGGKIGDSLLSCNPDGELLVHITKLYPTEDATKFNAFGRVMSGTIQNTSSVRVLGESYSLEDEEDSRPEVVSKLFIAEGR